VKKTKKALPPLTEARLQALALRYISRYAATIAMLERVLANHIRKAQQQDAAFSSSAAQGWVAAIITKYTAEGWLNDAALAERWVANSLQTGHSRRAIQQRLQHKGVAKALAEEKLQGVADADDLAAAHIFARKKRLGPHRTTAVTDAKKQDARDLAKLCRAGFGLQTARRALAGEEGV